MIYMEGQRFGKMGMIGGEPWYAEPCYNTAQEARAAPIWGNPFELERWRRIHVAIWAYAYEYLNESIVDDATFDATCRAIDVAVSTGNATMDAWFREHFDPCTGSWIYSHPELERIGALAKSIIARKRHAGT